jgi:division protein CdvB (Snf7/Vps24/ESCRT-III family)
MAKDLYRTKTHISKFIELRTHLNAVSLKLQTVKSHEAMSSAMKGVTKVGRWCISMLRMYMYICYRINMWM